MRVSSGHLCIYAQAPTEPTGETLPYGVLKKQICRGSASLTTRNESLHRKRSPVSPAGSVGASALWRRGVHRTPAPLNKGGKTAYAE